MIPVTKGTRGDDLLCAAASYDAAGHTIVGAALRRLHNEGKAWGEQDDALLHDVVLKMLLEAGPGNSGPILAQMTSGFEAAVFEARGKTCAASIGTCNDGDLCLAVRRGEDRGCWYLKHIGHERMTADQTQALCLCFATMLLNADRSKWESGIAGVLDMMLLFSLAEKRADGVVGSA